MKTFYITLLLSLFLFTYCTKNNGQNNIQSQAALSKELAAENDVPVFSPFTRDSIQSHLVDKIKKQQPLIVHIFVPLCDNEHQGIVPVNANLGNGKNLKTNLYWGARYGMKSFFLYDNTWKLTGTYPQNDTVLERVVFKKKVGEAIVYLIADAYRGDYMKICLEDFMNSVAQEKIDSVILNDSTILQIAGNADLLVFNGHNGLMDTYTDIVVNKTGIKKDAAVIGCISYNYFYERLNYAGGYPLLTTTSLMAPEAYCANALIEAWAQNKSEKLIVEDVAASYAYYQKCGINGARAIFKSGW